jgi:elongation factor 3
MTFKKMGFYKLVVSNLTDSSNTPPAALEGSLFILRALIETVGIHAEPYVLPLLPLVLNCIASNSHKDCAEDTARTMLTLVNTHAVAQTCGTLFSSLKHTEWRVKWFSLECFSLLAKVHPLEIAVLLPKIIPALTDMVWDTKTQVSKSAGKALLDCCNTNLNADIKPAVPAVVAAIVKPSETVKAIETLLHTTFIAAVDSSTLSMLCPVLSRALKEKLTNTKRMASIVIHNMSKLVDSPTAVAPFGPLLVPDLKTVVQNVQFADIREFALDALKALTKALGHSSVDEATAMYAASMTAESDAIQAEQDAVAAAKKAEEDKAKRDEKIEIEERKKFKEAMDAQRQLEKIEEEALAAKKAAERETKEMKKSETKNADGKCKSCGFKKCPRACMFYVKPSKK